MAKLKHWSDLDFASEVQSAVSRGPRPITRMTLLFVAVLFAGFLVWASETTIDEVTKGAGRVIPSSHLQIVESLEGGIVDAILVRSGEYVEQDQVLLRIDDTGFSSSLGELEAQHRALQAQIARLEAETSGRSQIAFPLHLVAMQDQSVQDELELFEARRVELETQIRILHQQTEQRIQEVEELRTEEAALDEALQIAEQELSIYLPLARSGVVARLDVLRRRREVNTLRAELEQIRGQVFRASAAIEEATAREEEARLTFQVEAHQDLNGRLMELSVVSESIRAAQDRVVRTDIRSPVRGIVNDVALNTVGAVVLPGMTLVEIVPLEDTLLVEARIRPSDVAFLEPGQPATVKLTAYEFSVHGGLEGRIERIGADTVTDETTGETFYRAIVRTEANYLGTEDDPLPIIPGMLAQVDIHTGAKTVLEYLLKPLIKGLSSPAPLVVDPNAADPDATIPEDTELEATGPSAPSAVTAAAGG